LISLPARNHGRLLTSVRWVRLRWLKVAARGKSGTVWDLGSAIDVFFDCLFREDGALLERVTLWISEVVRLFPLDSGEYDVLFRSEQQVSFEL
jgi:hypothetical protein